ncbi:MAG: DEAD/DEAH box helicase [Reyranella sp.]|uniref:DEAD/DEAH box helicase n=1 Tax=Reyranella sp. TaxID=1929291 RepID=UPI003D0DD20A
MSPAEQTNALSDLTPADLVIAELKALVGEPLTRSDFFSVVRAVRPSAPDGRPWSLSKVDDSIRLLARRRVLVNDGTIASGWRDPLTRRVLGRTGAAAVVAAVRGALPKGWHDQSGYAHWVKTPYSDVEMARSVRLAALANDGATVDRLMEFAGPADQRHGGGFGTAPLLFTHCPRDIGFIEGLSPTLADRVAAAHVEMAIDHGVFAGPDDALIDTLIQRGRDWAAAPLLDRALMRLDILGERADAARMRIARVRAFDPVAALAAEAALEFLTGSAVESLRHFRLALGQHRKAIGRTKAALPREFAVYHLLALLAADDPTMRGQIATLRDIVGQTRSTVAWAVSGLLDLDSAREDLARKWADHFVGMSARSRDHESPLDAAIATMALAVIDASRMSAREDQDWRAIQRWGTHARLAARIIAQAHAAVLPNPGIWRNTLVAFGSGYARDFMKIVPIRPAWDRALDKVQAFLAPPPMAKSEAPARTRRLVFLFNSDTLEIVPHEQTAKRDGWSAGRPVSLKRLHQRDAKLDYLTEEDLKVLGTISNRYAYYESGYEFDAVRSPPCLIGHPRVFDADAPDRRIDIVGHPVELVVREVGEHMRIELSHPCNAPQVFVERETPTRWRVVEVTPAIAELNAILGPRGLEAPKEARDRIVALIATDGPRLPVRSEIAGAAGPIDDGDTRPILQITPLDGNFTIRALVRPLGEDGPTYVPGVGARSVLVPAGGAHRRVNRDLEGETAALEAVAVACPALASWRETDHAWRIEALDAALEALQQLHEFTGPLRLEWPEGVAIKPTRTIGAGSLSLKISSGRDWFEVTGEVRVDEDLVLDMADVLARMGTTPGRFIAFDDGRYLALTEDLRRRLEGFAAVTETTRGGRRIAAAGAGAVEELVGAAGAVKADRRWHELKEKLAAAERYEPALPSGLDAEMRDYQRQGFVWLARLSRLGLGACLADDMGLGKTVQTLALLLTDAVKGPSLVVAPTSVCHNWLLEANRFAPELRVHMLAAAADRAALIESLAAGDVVVASYGLLHTEVEALASRRFAVAVFDEAQSLKNAETRRAQASKRIVADFRLALSGTPVENRLEELWSLYDTVIPGLLGSRDSFHRRFAGPLEKGHAGGQARQALKSLVRPFLLRRTKSAVLAELPSRTEITLEIEPGEEERAFYEALRRRALDNLAGAAGAGNQARIRILAEITRLRRAACNPALIDAAAGLESAKLAALLDLTAELIANRHRALVFSQFTGHLDLVETALKEAGVRLLRLDGSTPANERARRVAAFQAGEAELFLISLKAGGFGLNLTGADYVIHLDPWWNPAVEDQATDRAHRIGQTLPVTVYRLVMKDSIEERILALHAEKRALSADFLDGADQAATLDEEALMALIRG